MYEPVMLKHFMNSFGSIGRNLATHSCHLYQLAFSFSVLLLCGKLIQFISMTIRVHYYCVACNIHCSKLLHLFVCLAVSKKIKSLNRLAYLLFYSQKTYFKHPVTQYCMSGLSLIHISEPTRLLSISY